MNATVVIIAIVILAIVIFIDREIYYFDGAHLGPRAQGWLYNAWAKKYDSDKRKTQANDREVLAQPLLERLAAVHPAPADVLVLDVAAGTGRFSSILFQQPEFRGRIIAVDVSLEMLARAAVKVAPFKERIDLLNRPAFPLPFPDDSFDVVCCVEALELIPNFDQSMSELARVLRPGGTLLTSRCTRKWGYEFKLRTPEEITTLLQGLGLEQVEITPWWKWFDRVFARKQGQFAPAQKGRLLDILRCPDCGDTNWTGVSARGCSCGKCGKAITTSPEGIFILK